MNIEKFEFKIKPVSAITQFTYDTSILNDEEKIVFYNILEEVCEEIINNNGLI